MEELEYRTVQSWNTEDVISWIKGLSQSLIPHLTHFRAHGICGPDLLKLTRQQLVYLQVEQVGHQEIIMSGVDLLLSLENARTHNYTISLASTLSKKSSQLIKALAKSKKESSDDEEGIISQMESAAAVIMSAKSLINWLDRNPSNLIANYDEFRLNILKSAQELSYMMGDFDPSLIRSACQTLVKLTSVMMSPEVLSAVEPIQLLPVKLCPEDKTGLGFTIQRTTLGSLVITDVMEGSPAAKNGRIQVGAEIVQINSQNVVGWEVEKVVETMQDSTHELGLILKCGTLYTYVMKEDEVCDAEERQESLAVDQEASGDSVVADTSSESPRELSPTYSLSPGSSGGEVLDGALPASPHVEKLMKDQVFRTTSTPQSKIAAKSSENLLAKSDDPQSLSFEERLKKRTSSDSNTRIKKKKGQPQYPQVAYRTQIVGGVVVRIPIKEEVTQSARRNKNVQLGKKKVDIATPAASVQPVDRTSPPASSAVNSNEPSLQGKSVFSDPKDVTIQGQATKQITVTSTEQPAFNRGDAVRGSGKKANPALLVPCFQLKQVDHEGWMNKLGGSGLTPKNWRRRWFVLKDKKLYYYKTTFDISAMGIVELPGYITEIAPELKKKLAFKTTKPGSRTYYFQADSNDEMLRWIQVMTDAALTDGVTSPQSLEATDDKSDDDL